MFLNTLVYAEAINGEQASIYFGALFGVYIFFGTSFVNVRLSVPFVAHIFRLLITNVNYGNRVQRGKHRIY